MTFGFASWVLRLNSIRQLWPPHQWGKHTPLLHRAKQVIDGNLLAYVLVSIKQRAAHTVPVVSLMFAQHAEAASPVRLPLFIWRSCSIRIKVGMRLDLAMWLRFLFLIFQAFNGVSIFQDAAWSLNANLCLFTDSSAAPGKGFGATGSVQLGCMSGLQKADSDITLIGQPFQEQGLAQMW